MRKGRASTHRTDAPEIWLPLTSCGRNRGGCVTFLPRARRVAVAAAVACLVAQATTGSCVTQPCPPTVNVDSRRTPRFVSRTQQHC